MKIKKVSVVDQISEALKNNIMSHKWIPGDKLPSEGELSEEFGVNRLSVRMALQKLNTLGLVETKVGDGTYVRRFSLGPYLNEIAGIYNAQEHSRDVRELRNLLEGEAMRIAALSSTEEEREELKRRFRIYEKKREQYKQNLDNQELLDQLVDADFDFHYQIIRMSHNQLYKDIYYMTRKLIMGHIKNLVQSRLQREAQNQIRTEKHDEMIDAICNADIEALKLLEKQMLKILPLPGEEDDEEQG